jgi:hypothetical protein
MQIYKSLLEWESTMSMELMLSKADVSLETECTLVK